MSKRLDDIAARVEAATPGPWVDCGTCVSASGRGLLVADCYCDAMGNSLPEREHNSALIANAPADLRYLLAIARAAERVARVSDCMCGMVDGETWPWCALRAALESKEDVR